jgi:hypothetical protein
MKKAFKDLFPVGPALFAVLLLGSAGVAFAGSATWDLNPATNNWNAAVNWTPDTVPNGPTRRLLRYRIRRRSPLPLNRSRTGESVRQRRRHNR